MDEQDDKFSEIVDLLNTVSCRYKYTIIDDNSFNKIKDNITSTFSRAGCIVGEDIQLEMSMGELEKGFLNISIKAISDKGKEILEHISNQS